VSERPRALRRGGALSVGIGLLVALPAAAWAAAVPGATYTGSASDGATLSLTVSSDGTVVDSYHVLGILGKDANGAQCQGTAAEVRDSIWPGAPITANSFQDLTLITFSFAGTFDGPQSASGTFNLNNLPSPGTNGNPGSAGCTTGTVTWTATTSATPPGGGGPGGGGPGGGGPGGGGPGGGGTGGGGTGGGGTGGGGTGGGGSGGGSNGGPPKPKMTVHVRVGFRRMSAQMLGGTVKPSGTSSSKVCTARRAVILWSGHTQLRRARTTAKGAFTFKVTNAIRSHSVHAGVRSLTTSSVQCASANSAAIRVKALATPGSKLARRGRV
jgi:hypothetical protein